MYIETEATPNPDTLKFLPDVPVMTAGTAHYVRTDDASTSPLAGALFGLVGVEGVFLGQDYVSVTKAADRDWDALKTDVLAALLTFFTSGAPVFTGRQEQDLVVDEKAEDADIIEQIKTLLDEKIRPAVAGDGGDIVYRGFEDGVVYLQMQGACAGCPSSTITLKHGIENLLKYYVPEVVDVRPV